MYYTYKSNTTTWTWNYKSPEALIIAGIYTQDIINALQKHLLFPQEIESAQKNIARQSMGYDFVDQGLRLKSLLDEDAIGIMVESKLHKMWGWFTSFGTFISGLLGIFIIFRAIITTLNTGLNISILYQTFGWSFKLLAGIFSNLTQYIMHKAHNKQSNEELKYTKLPRKENFLNTTPTTEDFHYKEQSYRLITMLISKMYYC